MGAYVQEQLLIRQLFSYSINGAGLLNKVFQMLEDFTTLYQNILVYIAEWEELYGVF